jgi:hypothetical protein
MTKRIGFMLLLLALGVFGVLVVVLRPQAEEVEDTEAPSVSEADLQLYIKVYGAMQDDHDLTIDNAIKPHQISLEEFRRLELRIQKQSRLVERVRQALLDHAKEHSVFAQSVATPTPAPTPAGQKPPPQKKKK